MSFCCYYEEVTRKSKNIVDWFIRGKDGHVHIFQIPNVPIIGWFVLMLASNITPAGSVRAGISNLSLAFLAIWSYLEITKGASHFRRILGMIVASAVAYGFFK